MPVHFPDDLFEDDERREIAAQVFSKLRANLVLRDNAKLVDTVVTWFSTDEELVRAVIDELADCPEADLEKTSTGRERVYLTDEFLDNPDIGYTKFGDDP